MKPKISKKALKTLALLRKVPKVKLALTAGLGLALFSRATQGSKTYSGTTPFDTNRS